MDAKQRSHLATKLRSISAKQQTLANEIDGLRVYIESVTKEETKQTIREKIRDKLRQGYVKLSPGEKSA